MADTADTSNVIVRPPIAWAFAVLAGLALNWLMPLQFLPAVLQAYLSRLLRVRHICGRCQV
jgi:hypothetical protein